MRTTIAVLLALVWLLGILGNAGDYIHLLLIAAIALFISNLFVEHPPRHAA